MLLSESIDTNACVAANRVSSELRNILDIDYKTYKSTRHLTCACKLFDAGQASRNRPFCGEVLLSLHRIQIQIFYAD